MEGNLNFEQKPEFTPEENEILSRISQRQSRLNELYTNDRIPNVQAQIRKVNEDIMKLNNELADLRVGKSGKIAA